MIYTQKFLTAEAKHEFEKVKNKEQEVNRCNLIYKIST